MLKMSRGWNALLLLLLTGVALAGCTAESEGRASGGGSGGGGLTRDTGRPDIGTVDSGSVDGDEGSGALDTGSDVPAGPCTAGQIRCSADGSGLLICQIDGSEAAQPCASGQACAAGACVDASSICIPGTTVGCLDPRSLGVCPSSGAGIERSACPAETPNCLAGACTTDVCIAGVRGCQGDSVVQCNAEGTASDTLETCEFGCSAGTCVDPCAGDAKTYVGCDFYALDLDNFSDATDPAGADGQQYAITLSNAGTRDVSATVTTPEGYSQTVSIAAGALASVELPQRDVIGTSRSMNSYRVQSTGPIIAHQFNPLNNSGVFSNDASLLLPATALGTEYLVAGWPSGPAGASYFAVVAVAEGMTSVTVTAPPRSGLQAGGSVAGIPAGGSATFELTQGEVLAMRAEGATGDPTGTRVTSTKSVAVFSGNECANVPANVTYCDHVEEQMIPVASWDTEYLGIKFKPRGSESDVWRVIASTPGTTIQTDPVIAGVSGRTLGGGEVIEFASTLDFALSATGPISLSQMMVGSSYPSPANATCVRAGDPFPWSTEQNCAIPGTCDGTGVGDPAMLMAVPTRQFRDNYILLTPANYTQDFLSIVAPIGTVIVIDGNPLAVSPTSRLTAGGRQWDIYKQGVADGVHTVTGGQAFGLYAYGYDCDVSYAYAGGLNLEGR
ncbi:MAG: IgGFc-binding protein [Deltaproteobacteria bacterium]|nr:IgGFc-binding protein [Deltaproteobacteria bacterium]